jgi:hypothetical protein
MRPYLTDAWGELRSHMIVAPTSRLDNMLQNPAYLGYWEALRNDPTKGRIFFVSNYLQLSDADGVVTPTTANSLAPYLVGREIVGGTFSHWSPVARWLWVGDPRADLLPAQVESGDNRQIFGKSWDDITADELAANLALLNVTTLVAGANDQKAIGLFDSSPHFSRYWQNDFFTIFHLVSNNGDWVKPEGATAHLVERTARRWLIEVEQSNANATLLLKMTDYPLWQARVNGNRIPITATEEGLQQIALPEGAPYTLEVTYEEGVPEWIGLAISFASLLLCALLLIRPRRGPT